MITPSEYKKRYENIELQLESGGPVTVKVNKYRLAGSGVPGTAAVNNAARAAFLAALGKFGVNVPLRIDTGQGITRVDPRIDQHENALRNHQRDLLLTGWLPPSRPDMILDSTGVHRDMRPVGIRISDRPEGLKWDTRVSTHVLSLPDKMNDWNEMAILVFKGKGSPEACQAVLQLANHWGLAPDVQAYADSAMGLDCNGFVGNYIWHIMRGHPWTELGAHDHDLGPDAPLNHGYFEYYQSKAIKRWEALDAAKMYIMLEVGKDGVVINGGGGNASSAGHIVITEPNRRDERGGKDPKQSFAVWSVEATGGHTPEGLWESWYTCPNNASSTGVFSILREGMDAGHKTKDFRILAVS